MELRPVVADAIIGGRCGGILDPACVLPPRTNKSRTKAASSGGHPTATLGPRPPYYFPFLLFTWRWKNYSPLCTFLTFFWKCRQFWEVSCVYIFGNRQLRPYLCWPDLPKMPWGASPDLEISSNAGVLVTIANQLYQRHSTLYFSRYFSNNWLQSHGQDRLTLIRQLRNSPPKYFANDIMGFPNLSKLLLTRCQCCPFTLVLATPSQFFVIPLISSSHFFYCLVKLHVSENALPSGSGTKASRFERYVHFRQFSSPVTCFVVTVVAGPLSMWRHGSKQSQLEWCKA